MSKNKPHIHIYYDKLPEFRGWDNSAQELRSLTKDADAIFHIHIDGKKRYGRSDRDALLFMLGQHEHQHFYEPSTSPRLRYRLGKALGRIRAALAHSPKKEGLLTRESPPES